MAVWSSFAFKNIGKNVDIARRVFVSFKNTPKAKAITFIPVRHSHEKTMIIRNSTYEWFKFKDMVLFYAFLGAIPFFSLILYTNIFIGPATLALIPEGYDPKPWEYHRHPITRFMAKYMTASPQEKYERNLHSIFVKNESRMANLLEKKVRSLINEKRDYQAWFYHDPLSKFTRLDRERGIERETRGGVDRDWINVRP